MVVDPQGIEGASDFYYVFTFIGDRVFRTLFEPGGAFRHETVPQGWRSAAGTPTLVWGEEITGKVSYRFKQTQDGLRYTAVIPWPMMDGFRPKPGDAVGFNVRVKDAEREDGTERRRGYMEWSPGIGYYLINPDSFGTLEFR